MIAGGFLAAVAVGVAGFLVGRATSPKPQAAPPAASAPPAKTVIPAALQQPRLLGRADIVALASRAADAFASGLAPPDDVANLAGRRFDLVIVAGCEGPSAPDSKEAFRWRYDSAQQTLRADASPTAWTGDDWKIIMSPDTTYAAEGFWITRAWSSAESCGLPAVTADADAPAAVTPEHTLAIAQFTPIGAKPARSRAFSTVQRIAPDVLHPELGFRIRLTGRIERTPDGQPIQCVQPAGAEQRPRCVIAASFDELRLESPGVAGSLAVWPMGARAAAD